MLKKKLLARSYRIQNHPDAFISGDPRKRKQVLPRGFEVRDVLVAQKVQSRSQRRPPLLVPPRLTPRMTPAIANPAADSVRATPRSTFAVGSVPEFNFSGGWMSIEILAVICDLKSALWRLFS